MQLRKPVLCPQHQKRHVRHGGYGSDYSWGCPTCVKEWSKAIRALIEGHKKTCRGDAWAAANLKRKENLNV